VEAVSINIAVAFILSPLLSSCHCAAQSCRDLRGNVLKSCIRGKAKAIWLSIVIVLGFIFGTAAPATASGSGCAWSHGGAGVTCLGVDGTSYKVNWVRVSHHDGAKPIWQSYCGYKSKFEGRLTSGKWYSKTFGYTSGCTIAPYYNNANIYQYFRKGLSVQGKSYHDGAWAPGVAKVAIQ
jgi:hypothetical protein